MEASAQALLDAAAQTDAAIAMRLEPFIDDDGSSSLSDLDDGSEPMHVQLLSVQPPNVDDDDSEAETERIDDSPEKLMEQKQLAASPSKLAQVTVHREDFPEPTSYSDSAVSSPITSEEESGVEDLGDEDDGGVRNSQLEVEFSAKKRKHSLLEDDIDHTTNGQRHKRSRSIGSIDSEISEITDIDEDIIERKLREVTAEAEEDDRDQDNDSDVVEEDDEEQVQGPNTTGALENGLPEAAGSAGRAPRSKNPGMETVLADEDPEHPVEGAEESEEEDGADVDDADDAEAIAKSEEDQAKRVAAMEALTALEKHFATLRDRLYDERIASINNELAQLAAKSPTHSEFLRQIECVRQFRDRKFAIEQKLLIYKVGALKRKSVAERSQIHSAFFQTIRDVRELHLERVSEHFYRIQRDRFKTEARLPDYTIPFPDRRSVQISQQTAYNKEVSVLSGVAKYVGFPAAPDLPNARQKELEEDLENMGISPVHTRVSKQAHKAPMAGAFGSSAGRPAAEEQFIEQTPWANPQHPVHRQHFQMSRQASAQSQNKDASVTPAHQQRVAEAALPVGSASTILENASAQVSSALNTPYDDQNEPRNGASVQPNYRLQSSSPFDIRRRNSTVLNRNHDRPSAQQHGDPGAGSSPLAARAGTLESPTRPEPTPAIPRRDTASPAIISRFGRDTGILANSGLSRFSIR